jgi:hypothetical protein
MVWYLRNEVGPSAPDAGQFACGFYSWVPVAGAWSGPMTPTSALLSTSLDGVTLVDALTRHQGPQDTWAADQLFSAGL